MSGLRPSSRRRRTAVRARVRGSGQRRPAWGRHCVASSMRRACSGAAAAVTAAVQPPQADVSVPQAAAAAVEVRAAPVFPAAAGANSGAGTAGIRTVFLPLIGRQVPRVPGYDIAFEMAHGESPFVDPAVSASLAVDRPPLSLRSDSYDSLCDQVRRDRGRTTGRRPRRGGIPTVRTEDILAALPAPVGDGGSSGAGPGLGIGASLAGGGHWRV
jgi:hypothetical protein